MTTISQTDVPAVSSDVLAGVSGASLSAGTSPPPWFHVNLFGGFEIMHDGHPYDHPFLHRKKVKTLLAILVISEGRELNVEHLAGILWPTSDSAKAKNNLNNLWSLLRKALGVPYGGSCPYMIRHQGICKLDRSYIHSDLDEIADICDELQFGAPDADRAVALYRRLRSIVHGSLLPGEDENGIILRSRLEWAERMAEALYSASMHLQMQGDLKQALWLAQEALAIDESREDILRLKMRLHLDQGNPSRALASFNGSRRALEERYSLEPCSATLNLVDEVIYGPDPHQSPTYASQSGEGSDATQPAYARLQERMEPGRKRMFLPSDAPHSRGRNAPFPECLA